MKRQLTLLVVILCGFILVQACGESPTPTQECVSESPTPTPKCVNENWSYTDQATTQIEITPALKITIKDYELKFEVVLIVNPDGTHFYRMVIGVLNNSSSVGSGSTEIRLQFEPRKPRVGTARRC